MYNFGLSECNRVKEDLFGYALDPQAGLSFHYSHMVGGIVNYDTVIFRRT